MSHHFLRQKWWDRWFSADFPGLRTLWGLGVGQQIECSRCSPRACELIVKHLIINFPPAGLYLFFRFVMLSYNRNLNSRRLYLMDDHLVFVCIHDPALYPEYVVISVMTVAKEYTALFIGSLPSICCVLLCSIDNILRGIKCFTMFHDVSQTFRVSSCASRGIESPPESSKMTKQKGEKPFGGCGPPFRGCGPPF